MAVKENLTDEDLRKQIGHNLEKAIDRCIAYGLNNLVPIKDKLQLLPPTQARYEAVEYSFGELWTAYRLAHQTGTTILRNLTSQNTKGTIKRN